MNQLTIILTCINAVIFCASLVYIHKFSHITELNKLLNEELKLTHQLIQKLKRTKPTNGVL